MIYIKIEGGVITHRAVFDDKMPGDWPDRELWVVEDTAQIRWTHDKGVFSPPPASEPPWPAPPRTVRKSLIIERLNKAGKLEDASKMLNADVYSRERWYAPDQPAVHADNPEVLALLKAIDCNPDEILAKE